MFSEIKRADSIRNICVRPDRELEIERFCRMAGFLLAALFMGLMGVYAQDTPRLNVLFIAVDDLKPLLACYGDTMAVTPNIDAIARKGTLFESNYCQQAVCAPSRVSLMTSRYPDQTRVRDLQTQMREMNPGIVSLPQYLRKFSYRTAATGKIFDSRSVDDDRDKPSWSVPYGRPWDIRYYNEETGKPAAYFYASPEAKDTIAKLQAEAAQLGVDEMEHIRAHYFPPVECADVPVDSYTDGVIAKVGIELLDQLAAGDAPFFLAVGFNRPHLPFNAPREFWDLYDREALSLSPFQQKATGSPDIAYHNSGELRSYTGIPQSGPIPEETQLELIHGYYAATSYIDHLIGLLVNRLEELGLSERTAIVLWGDHGWHLGDHQLWCKHSNFEQATRSPLIISYPGQPNPGASTESPTEFTDMAPSICEIAQVAIPAYFEGESLVPLMEDTLALIRNGSLSQYPRNGRMGYSLRTERYRYTKWVKSDRSFYASELYDYQADPLETIDYSENPVYGTIVSQLDSIVSERMQIPSTQKKIIFKITGMNKQGDTVAIENAVIGFEHASQNSDAGGESFFTHYEGDFPFQIEADGYDLFSSNVRVRDDTVIHVYLGLPDMNVTFQVMNFYTGRGVSNTRVILNGLEKSTDNQGMVRFREKAGTFDLAVEHPTYENRVNSISIRTDTTFIFRLKPTHSMVKIWLKEGGAPVPDTPVRLDTMSAVSNAVGVARFDNVPTQTVYPYVVAKDGYEIREGAIHLVMDTSVTVQMERITTGTNGFSSKELILWPNPAREVLHLELTGKGPFHITLTNISGQLIYDNTIAGSQHQINFQSFRKGIYLLTIRSSKRVLARHIIKI
jgi:arylsulfatase A-like enzyme